MKIPRKQPQRNLTWTLTLSFVFSTPICSCVHKAEPLPQTPICRTNNNQVTEKVINSSFSESLAASNSEIPELRPPLTNQLLVSNLLAWDPFNLPVAMTRINAYSRKHLCLSCLNGLSWNCHPWVCRLFDKLAWDYIQCDLGPRIPFSSNWSLPTQKHTTQKLPA